MIRKVGLIVQRALAAWRRRHHASEARAELFRELEEMGAKLDELAYNTELVTSQLGVIAFNTELLLDESLGLERRRATGTSSRPPRPSLPASHLAAIAEVKGSALPRPPPVPREERPFRRPRSGIIRKE